LYLKMWLSRISAENVCYISRISAVILVSRVNSGSANPDISRNFYLAI